MLYTMCTFKAKIHYYLFLAHRHIVPQHFSTSYIFVRYFTTKCINPAKTKLSRISRCHIAISQRPLNNYSCNGGSSQLNIISTVNLIHFPIYVADLSATPICLFIYSLSLSLPHSLGLLLLGVLCVV